MDGLNFKGDIRMIELNKGQKIAGFIFAAVIAFFSLICIASNGFIAGIVGLAISAGLVMWCLSNKPKS